LSLPVPLRPITFHMSFSRALDFGNSMVRSAWVPSAASRGVPSAS
jgi:hypothetical protein